MSSYVLDARAAQGAPWKPACSIQEACPVEEEVEKQTQPGKIVFK